MRDNSRTYNKTSKVEARRRYAQRKIDKYIKWSITQRGCLKWKDLVEQQNMYNIKVV